MRTVHVYPQNHQPPISMVRATDAKSGLPLPHRIVSIDGKMIKEARGGGTYEHECTVHIDTSKFLAVVADEEHPYSYCRIHAEGLSGPLLVSKSMNFVLIELGFDPSHLNNKTPVAATDFLY